MNLIYFLLIITLKDANCYEPRRHTQTTSASNFKSVKSKSSDPVIPARYKIASTTNYEDITKSFPTEFFPEVEYPESIADSSKPFYLSASPFPNDVKKTFNSLAARENSKPKPTIDYSWTPKENNKEMAPATSQIVGVYEITVTKGNEISSNDKGTNETLHEDISMLGVKEDSAIVKITYSDSDTDKLFANWSSTEQSAECDDDVDYIAEFINDLDKVMKNITNIDSQEFQEGNNTEVNTFESECSDEYVLMYSDMTPNNVTRRHITELNENSCHSEEHPDRIRILLFDDSDTNETLPSLTFLNVDITNASSVEDMQSDFCNIGPVANETNTSCTES